MRPARVLPQAQLFVCTNSRAASDPLTSGCGATGPAVFDAARALVNAQGRLRTHWVTRTGCLGQCPRTGCAVALWPSGEQWIEADTNDVAAMVARLCLTAPNRGEP
ncbi:MAG: (2Fe-2S) ferredoxin domain-containing protein [Deltaproteobacteria bacterium]|nr:(2Fe-2S) ferredoxin domain-containing protein [Deltaproteobacteria bacterium]